MKRPSTRKPMTRSERALEIARRAKAVLAGKPVVFETGAMFDRIRDELRRQTLRTRPR
ncbi:MAG: hypothetical protein H0T79_22845 [Deltaproteobacteria bacterium]|nr:hypothetical protein [Deltaproteobacteria bacterium]